MNDLAMLARLSQETGEARATLHSTLDLAKQTRDLLEVAIQRGKAAVAACEQLPRTAHAVWESLCRTVEAGGVENAQLQRDVFLESLEQEVAMLRHLEQEMETAPSITALPIFYFQKLRQARIDLEALKNSIFPRWQTQEDLESLVLARHALTNEELAAVRKTLPAFHAQWYNEESKSA